MNFARPLRIAEIKIVKQPAGREQSQIETHFDILLQTYNFLFKQMPSVDRDEKRLERFEFDMRIHLPNASRIIF